MKIDNLTTLRKTNLKDNASAIKATSYVKNVIAGLQPYDKTKLKYDASTIRATL